MDECINERMNGVKPGFRDRLAQFNNYTVPVSYPSKHVSWLNANQIGCSIDPKIAYIQL
jgi:hypothetical protein